MLTGPPPLGPGAPPADRLAALTAEQVCYWRHNQELPLPELTRVLVEISRQLTCPDPRQSRWPGASIERVTGISVA